MNAKVQSLESMTGPLSSDADGIALLQVVSGTGAEDRAEAAACLEEAAGATEALRCEHLERRTAEGRQLLGPGQVSREARVLPACTKRATAKARVRGRELARDPRTRRTGRRG